MVQPVWNKNNVEEEYMKRNSVVGAVIVVAAMFCGTGSVREATGDLADGSAGDAQNSWFWQCRSELRYLQLSGPQTRLLLPARVQREVWLLLPCRVLGVSVFNCLMFLFFMHHSPTFAVGTRLQIFRYPVENRTTLTILFFLAALRYVANHIFHTLRYVGTHARWGHGTA